MEPVTSGSLVATLLKLGAGSAAGPLKSLLKRKTLRRRVARRTAKAAKPLGIQVARKDLRHWLGEPEVQNQLSVGRASEVESCVHALSVLIGAEPNEGESRARQLLSLVLSEYHRAQSSQDGVVLATSWVQDQVAAEATATRGHIDSQTGAILDALGSDSVFEQDLNKLHPWRSQMAEELAGGWPALRGFVHSLVVQTDRGPVLRDWAADPPTHLQEAPADVWCWLGVVAADYGQREAACTFIIEGINRGATPANYWWARAALSVNGEESAAQARARELVVKSQPPHPLAAAFSALLEERYADAETELAGWNAGDPNDRSIKAVLLTACAAGQSDFNRSITIGIEASDADPEGSGVTLRTAEALLSRGHYGPSDNPLADFARARSLAIKARDSRRRWLGDSVAAILVAIKASALSTDIDRAWRLTQAAPDGEATDEERCDWRLRRESAVLAATLGEFEHAEALAADIGDQFTSSTVEGWIAIGRRDATRATSAWMGAWAVAPDDFAKVQTAAALAPLGGQMPDLTDLALRQSDAVRRIRVIHEVMSAPGDRLTLMRAKAPESEQLTVLLAEHLVAEGSHADAAAVLEDGANRWNHPLLMRMAADRYLHAGKYAKAADASSAALTLGGTGWAGELEALMVRFDALEAQALQAESLLVVRQMTAVAPDNLNVRWALVHCLVRRGDLDAAWVALTYKGEPVTPRGVDDARTWIALVSTYDTSPSFVSRALTVMRRWGDDPDLVGIYLAQIYMGLTRNTPEVHESDIQALHAATAEYTEKHPESRTFWSAEVGPDDNPLAAVSANLKREAEDSTLADLRQKVSNGELPLGLIAEVAGRSYVEASIKRAAGLVFSHASPPGSAEHEAVSEALGKSVAIDSTAAVTLALLAPPVVDQLLGVFQSTESTDHAYRDALAAQQSLQLRSTLSVVWNEELQKPVPVEISEEVAERLAVHADRTVEVLTRSNRRGWPTLRRFQDLNIGGAWLSTVDFAISSTMTLWCDDRLIRSLATQDGVPAFGTVDLLRELVRTGRMQPELAKVAESVLIDNFYVDLGFDREVMRLAAQLSLWEPSGAAAALTRPAAWADPAATVGFAVEALGEVAGNSPTAVRAWVSCAAVGLLRIAMDDAQGASGNLRILLAQLMTQSWMRPDVLPHAVAGIRDALRDHPAVSDPLDSILQSMYETLVEAHGSAAASQLLLMWVRHMPDDDRRNAARSILTSER